MKQKVLIIKTGYSETLDHNITTKVSLGDVFSTTVILHLFKDENVTWLTGKEAFPLLEGNRYIDRILDFNLLSSLALMDEEFDIVINLEKDPGFCALTNKIKAWQRYGFRIDHRSGKMAAYEKAGEALQVAYDLSIKQSVKKSNPEYLYEMLGKKFQGEPYLLGYRPDTKIKYDFGFNPEVGEKWPVKAWPKKHWGKLEKLLKGKHRISYQHHLKNIHGYIDWLASCKTIISSDSLGAHLAIALGKKTIIVFGPSLYTPFYDYKNIVKIVAPKESFPCLGCMQPVCAQPENFCMDAILPEWVYRAAVE